MYRPPKLQAADDTALYEGINTITWNKKAVIIGDFNCPNVDWNLMHGDLEGNRLVEMIEDAFLMQIVTQPTRENNVLEPYRKHVNGKVLGHCFLLWVG